MSSYYQSQCKTENTQSDEYKAKFIEEIQIANFYTLGRRRIGVVLKAKTGLQLGEKQLGRLMKRYGLNAQIRRTRRPSNGYK